MEPHLIGLSFLAGVLTILAPCIFPLLPILIGSSADGKANKNRAFTVIASLLVSIIILTVLIHGTSNVLGLSQGVLRLISAIIIVFVGVVSLFPQVWMRVSMRTGLESSSNGLLGKAMKKDGRGQDILIGAALGPVFSSCSPTYGLIIGTILPQSFFTGFVYLLWYVVGLGLMFGLIAILGHKFTAKLSWATDPNGWFKRAVGILFVVIGVAILFNFDKSFETWLLGFDFYTNLVEFEIKLNN